MHLRNSSKQNNKVKRLAPSEQLVPEFRGSFQNQGHKLRLDYRSFNSKMGTDSNAFADMRKKSSRENPGLKKTFESDKSEESNNPKAGEADPDA